MKKLALNSRQKEIVESITDTVRFPGPGSEGSKENHLYAVQFAIIKKKILRIVYLNRKDEQSEREIEPIGLTFYSDHWHTIAYCWKRKAYRDFIISSIQELHITSSDFRKPDHITLNDYIGILINS